MDSDDNKSHWSTRDAEAWVPKPQFSVVIPAFNEDRILPLCLYALERQTFSPERFEVILVDNGSTDKTVAIASVFSKKLNLKIISIPRGGISAARNLGASQATGNYLAFLDADCIPEPTWLEIAATIAASRQVFGAHYRIPAESTWVGRLWLKYQAKEEAGEVSFLAGGDLFISRDDFSTLGGFNEAVETSEDVELCSRARARNFSVIADPALAVIHEGTPQTLTGFYKQNRWHGRHVLRNFVSDLPSTRNFGVVALSLYTLIGFWCVLLLLFWSQITGHGGLLALLAACLLALPPFLLSFKKAALVSAADIPQLFVLYLVYSLSRAAALTHYKSRKKR